MDQLKMPKRKKMLSLIVSQKYKGFHLINTLFSHEMFLSISRFPRSVSQSAGVKMENISSDKTHSELIGETHNITAAEQRQIALKLHVRLY